MLTLKKLQLERCDWNHKAEFGKVTGKIVFDGERGEISLNLTDDQVHRMFLVVADSIVATAKEAASALLVEAQATIAKETAPRIERDQA